MQDSRFVVLTGHLDSYPLSDLVGILRHQRKTGRLLIEYAKGPGVFYFKEGELVDAQLNDLSGLQAICVAVAQPAASFNFNPLIQPPRTSIERSLQRVVSELFGCWDESPLQIESVANDSDMPDLSYLPPATSDSHHSLEARPLEPLALPAASIQPSAVKERRTILVMAAAGLMMLGLSSVIAVTGGFTGKESTRPIPLPTEMKERLTTESIGQPPPKTGKSSSEGSRGRQLGTGWEQSHRQTDSTSLDKQSGSSSPKSSNENSSATISSTPTGPEKKSSEVPPGVQSVNVVMKIENGRVSQASITNHKVGMDSYEALALRIARQRRYASQKSGEETVRISVAQPK